MKRMALLVLAFALFMPSALRTYPAKPALEVAVLGSGGPRAFGRAGSSYLVLVEGTPRILVDAGPGAFLRIGELELDLEKVDTVLLTHLHIDHSADLAAFFNARALTSDGPVSYRIFGPDGTGVFPKTSRFVDLLVGDGGAFAYQKTFSAQESFAVRDLPISLASPRTKIVDEDGGLVVEEIANASRRLPVGGLPNLVQGCDRSLFWRHGRFCAAESRAIGEERRSVDFQLRRSRPARFPFPVVRSAYSAEENWRSRALERRKKPVAESPRSRRGRAAARRS